MRNTKKMHNMTNIQNMQKMKNMLKALFMQKLTHFDLRYLFAGLRLKICSSSLFSVSLFTELGRDVEAGTLLRRAQGPLHDVAGILRLA
jgi:hypothetical protein